MKRSSTHYVALGVLVGGCLLQKAEIVPEPAGAGGEPTSDAGSPSSQAGADSLGGVDGVGGAGGASACSKGDYHCSGNVLESCDSGTFAELKHCVTGTCDADQGDCTEACKDDGSDCDSGVCLRIGVCEPPLLTVKGYVQHWDSTSIVYEKNVEVTATNILPDQPTGSSNDAGAYEIRNIPPASLLDLEVYWSGQTADVTIPPALRTMLVSLRAKVNNPADGYDVKANMPVVPFSWLAQVAVDCGIFPSLAAATGSDQLPKVINSYWVQRSTLIADVLDEAGKPVAGLTRDDIEVVLSGFSNKDHGTNDTDTYPAQVCFLQPNPANTSQLIGSKLTKSTSTGRFVMFRLRNQEHGTGDGVAEVNISGYPPASVSLLSSGNIGSVSINAGPYVEPAPRDRTFEGDVYPILATYGCVGCHSKAGPGMMTDGAGYKESKARGPKMLHANYSGTPDEVYEVLMAADDGADCTDPQTAQRICLKAPEASLLAKKPLKEIGDQDHPTTAFRKPEDADYRAIVEWIEQGAQR